MENVRTAFTVAKLSLFMALAVIAFLAIKQPYSAPGAEERKAAPTHMSVSEPASDDVVIAIINGENLYRNELLASFSQLPPQAQQMGMEIVYPMLLERVIDEKLLAIAANKEIAPNDPEVDKQIAMLRGRVNMQVYFGRKLEEKLTDDRLQEVYQKQLEANPAEEEVRARHILVESQEKAMEILAEIQGGKDFAEAAMEHSTGPSGPQGGDLGYFTAAAMVKPFSDVAFAMEVGAVSQEPVKTDFGWHVIKVEDRRTQPQPSFEEMREELSQQESQEIASEILGGLRSGATIEKFDMDGNPVPAGEGEQPAQQ